MARASHGEAMKQEHIAGIMKLTKKATNKKPKDKKQLQHQNGESSPGSAMHTFGKQPFSRTFPMKHSEQSQKLGESKVWNGQYSYKSGMKYKSKKIDINFMTRPEKPYSLQGL